MGVAAVGAGEVGTVGAAMVGVEGTGMGISILVTITASELPETMGGTGSGVLVVPTMSPKIC